MDAVLSRLAIARAAVKRRRDLSRRRPSVIPQLIPANEKFESLIYAMWGLTLGQARSFLPVSNNGKRGAAIRYYFVVALVERFLLNLPTSRIPRAETSSNESSRRRNAR